MPYLEDEKATCPEGICDGSGFTFNGETGEEDRCLCNPDDDDVYEPERDY